MIAVIGTGYWGSKIVAALQNMNQVVEQFDINDSIDKIKADKVIIATPAKTHVEIIVKMIKQNKMILVEKPAFMNMKECKKIEKIIKNKFMVGHILLYSEHFNYIKEHLQYLPKNILFVESRRLNWGRAQNDISPISHLATHDVAVFDVLLGKKIPNIIKCTPYYITQSTQPDYVLCDLTYGDVTVQIQTGWLYNEKIRNIKIFTDKGIFDWKDEINETKYFTGKVSETFSEYKSSLHNQLTAFIDYCDKDVEPVSNFSHAKRVTYVIDCMEESLRTGEVICPSKKY
tara:strand:- start:5768 stop:6628 length:861 start_codon:yes stop_codon:yes gene_type:complete